MHDLAVIVISTNEGKWLEPCLRTVFEHAGPVDLDVVVADNQSTDGTAQLVEREFPEARVVPCANRGFSHANNRALMTCDARYVLFLNPDTEVVDGTFAELVDILDRRPEVGVAGVKQLLGDGTLAPTIRRFPSIMRALGEALGSERLPFHPSWMGERELDPGAYDRETACDWTVGSFMLVRREALEGAGFLDERFFITSEENDLCYRAKRGGWEVVHFPQMTIIHHAGKAGIRPKMEAQYAFGRKQYAHKNFSRVYGRAYVAAVAARYLVRAAYVSRDRDRARQMRAASRAALRVLTGLDAPPFGPPPPTAVWPREQAQNPRSAEPAAVRRR